MSQLFVAFRIVDIIIFHQPIDDVVCQVCKIRTWSPVLGCGRWRRYLVVKATTDSTWSFFNVVVYESVASKKSRVAYIWRTWLSKNPGWSISMVYSVGVIRSTFRWRDGDWRYVGDRDNNNHSQVWQGRLSGRRALSEDPSNPWWKWGLLANEKAMSHSQLESFSDVSWTMWNRPRREGQGSCDHLVACWLGEFLPHLPTLPPPGKSRAAPLTY